MIRIVLLQQGDEDDKRGHLAKELLALLICQLGSYMILLYIYHH